MAPSPGWVSATDLAEYAYCPRAYYYRDHPPPGGPTRSSQQRSRAGERYHARELGAERRRAEHGTGYVVVLVVGLLLALGGLAWLFYR
jgi:CRISPR/Cas system-associated exonuclease Cas4 (RecB family)